MMCGEATGQMPKTVQYQCQLAKQAEKRVQVIELMDEKKSGRGSSSDAMTRAFTRCCKSC
jgi:hypothetical protein